MKVKNNRTLFVTTLLCLVPIMIGLLLWDKLPNELPTHFDFFGNPDQYSTKTFAVFALPGFILVVNLIVNFALNNDPKNVAQNSVMMNLGMWVAPIISILVTSMSYMIALGYGINISTVIAFVMGLLFVVIGNYMPKVKQNYTIGIKLPWTLNSEINWNRTHRFAGYIWMVFGLVLIVTLFLMSREVYAFVLFIGALSAIILPTIYSYILYKKGLD